MPAAHELTVTQKVPRPLTIEWREDTPTGTKLLAARSYPVERVIKLPVLAAGTRIVRFRRESAAPLTAVVSKSDSAYALEPPSAGAEVYIALRRSLSAPASVVLSSSDKSSDVSIPVARDHAIAMTKLDGPATVTGMFAGGVKSRTVPIRLSQNATTEVSQFPKEESGGAEIAADSSVCTEHRDATFIVYGDETRKRLIAEYPVTSVKRCTVHVEGLAPGSHRAEVQEHGTVIVHGTFAIKANEIASAFLEPYGVRVSGVATYGKDSPASDVTLEFTPGRNAQSVGKLEARTDTFGKFSIELPAPDSYAISFRASDFVSLPVTTREFAEGNHTVLLELPGTQLTIKLVYPPGKEQLAAQLQMSGPQPMNAPLVGTELRLPGLLEGDYRISATAGPMISEPQNVTLTAGGAPTTVELTMEEGGGVLTLTDSGGRPVSNARVLAGARQLVEQSPGRYGLEGVAVGTRIQAVASGYIPSCGTRDALRGSMQLVLGPVGVLSQKIRVGATNGAKPYLSVAGTSCWVSIGDIPSAQGGAGRDAFVTFTALPPGPYMVSFSGSTKSITVPGPEISFVPEQQK
jgi:hypothetical protein